MNLKRIVSTFLFLVFLSSCLTIDGKKQTINGNWQVTVASDKQDDFLGNLLQASSSLLDTTELVIINDHTIEIPRGITLRTFQDCGNFLPYKLTVENLSIFNPCSNHWLDYLIDKHDSSLVVFNLNKKKLITLKKVKPLDTPLQTLSSISITVNTGDLISKELSKMITWYKEKITWDRKYIAQNKSYQTTKHLSPNELAYLSKLVSRVNFKKLPAHYPALASDLPSVTIETKIDEKQIIIKAGNKASLPYHLLTLVNYLERLENLGTKKLKVEF